MHSHRCLRMTIKELRSWCNKSPALGASAEATRCGLIVKRGGSFGRWIPLKSGDENKVLTTIE